GTWSRWVRQQKQVPALRLAALASGRDDGYRAIRDSPRGLRGLGVFGMPPNERDHEAACRHDLEAAAPCVIEGGADQLRGYALAFILRRYLGVGENRAIGLLVINCDRDAMIGVELVAVLCHVVSDRHCRRSLHVGISAGRTIGVFGARATLEVFRVRCDA